MLPVSLCGLDSTDGVHFSVWPLQKARLWCLVGHEVQPGNSVYRLGLWHESHQIPNPIRNLTGILAVTYFSFSATAALVLVFSKKQSQAGEKCRRSRFCENIDEELPHFPHQYLTWDNPLSPIVPPPYNVDNKALPSWETVEINTSSSATPLTGTKYLRQTEPCVSCPCLTKREQYFNKNWALCLFHSS